MVAIDQERGCSRDALGQLALILGGDEVVLGRDHDRGANGDVAEPTLGPELTEDSAGLRDGDEVWQAIADGAHAVRQALAHSAELPQP